MLRHTPITISSRLKHLAIFRQLEDIGLEPGGCIIHGRLIIPALLHTLLLLQT